MTFTLTFLFGGLFHIISLILKEGNINSIWKINLSIDLEFILYFLTLDYELENPYLLVISSKAGRLYMWFPDKFWKFGRNWDKPDCMTACYMEVAQKCQFGFWCYFHREDTKNLREKQDITVHKINLFWCGIPSTIIFSVRLLLQRLLNPETF